MTKTGLKKLFYHQKNDFDQQTGAPKYKLFGILLICFKMVEIKTNLVE